MSTSRFFLANLPSNTKEKDLKLIFQDYGEVVRVELKTKENLVEPENVKIIAFVTLKIDEADAQYCINELNWQKLHGQQLKVTLAKESFLDRLKREREEAEAAAAGASNSALSAETNAELLTQNVENTRKTFADDLDIDDNDDGIEPGLLITKKRAANSLHNGKIFIQSYDTTPIHVINNKQQSRQLDAKSTAADQKRKQSLNKKKNQYQQNKSAIQQSLAGLDVSSKNKIKFSDTEDEDKDAIYGKNVQDKTNIFGSDNEGNDDDMRLDLKPEYFGKKGEQLMKLQTTQSLDPRFKIDAKFVRADDDEQDHADIEDEQHENQQENERDWQMGILEQVVGTKIDTKQEIAMKASKNKKMLRFDPLKNEHQKFLRAKDNETAEKVVSKKQIAKQKKIAQDNAETASPEVSKEVFYMVTDSLSQSLKTRGDGFSLLNMFGSAGAQSEEQREDNLKKVTHEKILVNNMDKNALNPFIYDSSSDSDDEELTNQADSFNDKNQTDTKKPGKHKQTKIFMETFFIPKNDVRLKEGAKFFKCEKKSESTENYEGVRNRLKMLIRTKITKSKKQLGGKNKAKNKFS